MVSCRVLYAIKVSFFSFFFAKQLCNTLILAFALMGFFFFWIYLLVSSQPGKKKEINCGMWDACEAS